MVIELRLEPSLQITFLFLVAESGRTRLIEQSARPSVVPLVEQQLDGTQLRPIIPLRIGKKRRQHLQRFVPPLQGPQRFRLPEEGGRSKRRCPFRANLLVKRKRLIPPLQARQRLCPPKPDSCLIL